MFQRQPKQPNNNRKYDRIKVCVPGQLNIKKIQGQTVGNRGAIDITIEDVSSGGIYFTSLTQLPVSPLVIYEVVFILDEKRVAMRGIIQRKITETRNFYGYGFSFEHESFEEFNLLYTFLSKKLKNK